MTYRHFRVGDQAEVVNANAPNFRQEGEIVATDLEHEQENMRSGFADLSKPYITVRFPDGFEHAYIAEELNRLNRDEDEIAEAARLAAMTEEEFLAELNKGK